MRARAPRPACDDAARSDADRHGLSARRLAPTVAAALACLALLLASRACALDPPPAASFAAVVGDVDAALREAAKIAAATGVEAPVAQARDACAALVAAPARCSLPAEDRCAAELRALYAALRTARSDVSPRRAAAIDAVVADVADAVSRLALAPAALARGACDRIAGPGEHPTRLVVSGDARRIDARPLVALRPGRRYALVAYGASPDELAAMRASLAPRPEERGLAVPDDAFAGAVAADLPDDAGGISTARTRELVRRLEADARALPGLGPFAGVRVTLPASLRAEQLGVLRLAFVPADDAPDAGTLAVFATLDARAGLVAARARLATLDCPGGRTEPRDAKQALGVDLPHVGSLLHGTYRSLDVAGDGAPPLGVPAASARQVELPYLLALPRGWSDATPLVVTVDGHAGSAARIVGKHADALVERGLAVLAVELPAHGERKVAGLDFLDALDPAALGRNVRQAAVDVVAAIRTATQCGLVLPDGARYRPSDVRYLGYSLGAMVGVLVRSVEPGVGTAVLVAPGGDILGWLLLRIPPELGGTYVTCLGGPDEGASCIPHGECPAPGVCIVDPYLDRLALLLGVPYALAAAAADPLSYASVRTGDASEGRVLLITGGEDAALHPALATRLADAYGMRPVAPHERRGPRSRMVQWPKLGHELLDRPGVRAQAYAFLASDGRRVPDADEPPGATAPGWYRVFGASRE